LKERGKGVKVQAVKEGRTGIQIPGAFSLPRLADLSPRPGYLSEQQGGLFTLSPPCTFNGGKRMADYKESDPFYHSAAWKRLRRVALMRDGGMCQDCMDRMRAGIGIKPNRATLVHHIIPRSERPDLELDPDNLRALCAECHEKEHPERRSKKKRKTLERIGSHSCRVIKV
jgi:hypothetical protein